jgi:excisionase family DNA binding protein
MADPLLPPHVSASQVEIHPTAVYTVAEIADLLGLEPRTVRQLIWAGWLPATRPGRDYRILGSWLLQALGRELP